MVGNWYLLVFISEPEIRTQLAPALHSLRLATTTSQPYLTLRWLAALQLFIGARWVVLSKGLVGVECRADVRNAGRAVKRTRTRGTLRCRAIIAFLTVIRSLSAAVLLDNCPSLALTISSYFYAVA